MNHWPRAVGHCRQVLGVNNGGCRQLLRQFDVKCSPATRQVVVGSFFSLAALRFIIKGLGFAYTNHETYFWFAYANRSASTWAFTPVRDRLMQR